MWGGGWGIAYEFNLTCLFLKMEKVKGQCFIKLAVMLRLIKVYKVFHSRWISASFPKFSRKLGRHLLSGVENPYYFFNDFISYQVVFLITFYMFDLSLR